MAPLSSHTLSPWTPTTLLLALLVIFVTPASYVAALLPRDFDACGIRPPVIGVDLGTTYSRVGVYRNGRVEKIIIIANDQQGNRTTSSWAASTAGGGEHSIYDAVNAPLFIPVALALARAKETAEAYLGEEVAGAVVTVPSYFNYAQRWATKRAGDVLAGLPVLRIVNASIAASIAYGIADKRGGGAVAGRKVLVFDLSGGMLDVSVLAVDRDGYLETLATSGEDDYDRRVADHFVGLVRRRHDGRDDDVAAGDARAMAKLRRECARALSGQRRVRVEVEQLVDGVDLSEQLARARFEELNGDLFRKAMVPVRKALADAGLGKADIDDFVLVGGSSWIPKVQRLLKDYFDGKEPTRSRGVKPDEAVAYGAALHGAFLIGHDVDETRCSFRRK